MTKNRYSQVFNSKESKDFHPNLLNYQYLNLKIKTLQNSLKNSEEMYKKIIMTSNDAIIMIDKRFDILFSSDKAAQIFGFWDEKSMEGRKFFDLVLPDERKIIKAIFKRAFNEGFVGNFRSKFIKKEKEFYGLVNIARVNNADKEPFALLLTIRYLEENDNVSEKELYKTIFNKSNDAIVLHTIENKKPGKFFEVNKAACEQLGLSKNEILKKTPFDFYAKFNKKIINLYLKRLRENKKAIFEVPVKKSNGDIINCEVNSHVFKYNNKSVVLSIIRNISERTDFQNKIEKNFLIMKKIMDGVITAMEKLVEKKDKYTVGHQRRTAELAKFIAKEYGLSDEQIECIYISAVIHDIGKIFISGSILNKPRKLTKEEYEIIKTHSEEGYKILKSIYFPWPVAEIIYQHHERIDGSGYPRGLKGDKILLEAKIIGIADVIEAMTFKRPYRKALGINKALDEIIKNKGILYDNDISKLCLNIFRKNKFKFIS